MTDMSAIIIEPDDTVTINNQKYLVSFPHPYIAKLELITPTNKEKITNGNIQPLLNDI